MEAYLGENVTEAVISTCIFFRQSRQATKDAGKITGLDVKEVNEPTAALAYGLEMKRTKIMVYIWVEEPLMYPL